MDNISTHQPANPFISGFPLQDYPAITDEVLFAVQLDIKKIIYLNEAFEKVWQLPRNSIGRNLTSLFDTVHEEDKQHILAAFIAIKNEKKKQSVEFRIVLPDKTQKWIKLNAYVPAKNNQEIVVGNAVDITVEKDYSFTLHEYATRKNSILQILSHDLLGPLGNIQLSTELLAENTGLMKDESTLKVIDIINQNCNRGIKLIRDLINSEFLETADSAFVPQRIDIVQKISTLVDQYKQSPLGLTQRFRFTSSTDKLYMNVDESKFLQAINNLLSNALKFTPEDGSIDVSIRETDEKNILITVKDNGIGIPENLQPFLFDKFTKARRNGLHGEPSTGLGMSIIKTIIEWHGGRIWFESTENKGTTFYIELPKK